MSSWVGPAIQAGGAVLGGALGGKKSGGNKAPKWLRRSARGLADFGANAAQQPYQAYSGERVAPFSQDTLNAFDMIRNNVGAATPAYQNAMSTANNLTGFNAPQVQDQFDPRLATANLWAGQSLDPYMNPYISDVIDAQAADQQHSLELANNMFKGQAAAAKAFGGNRFGVAQGQLAADAVRNQALTAAQLRSQGFDTAAGLLSEDVDRKNAFEMSNQAAQITADQMGLQAGIANQGSAFNSAALRGNSAALLGGLANDYQNTLYRDTSGLGAAGSAQQALAQQGLDVGYGNYLDQRNYPSQQINWWGSALNPGIGVAGMTQPGQSGGLLGTLGGAQVGAGVGTSIYDWFKNMGMGGATAGGGTFGSGRYA